MEGEKVDTKLMTRGEREAFVYSLDVIRVALQNGWRIKIFQRDNNLAYLRSILLDIDIPLDEFFNFNQFVEEKKPKSAYEWAREVQRKAFDTYMINGQENDWFPEALMELDKAYNEDIEPWERLTKEQLVDVNTRCKWLTDYVYSLE